MATNTTAVSLLDCLTHNNLITNLYSTLQQTAAQSAAEETKTYTQAEIEKMSRENIIALGTKLGYTMTTTASDEKSAVVADFMAQQTAAQNK